MIPTSGHLISKFPEVRFHRTRIFIKATDAIGIVSKPRRYGGTYAHTDIAFEFALYIIWRLKKSISD